MSEHTVKYRHSTKKIGLSGQYLRQSPVLERFDLPVEIMVSGNDHERHMDDRRAMLFEENAKIVANWLSHGLIPDHSTIKINGSQFRLSGMTPAFIIFEGLAAGIKNGFSPKYLHIEAYSLDDGFAIYFAELFNGKKLPGYFSLDLIWCKFTAEGARAFARLFQNTCSYKFSLSIPLGIKSNDYGIMVDAMATHIQNCPTCTTTPYLDTYFPHNIEGPEFMVNSSQIDTKVAALIERVSAITVKYCQLGLTVSIGDATQTNAVLAAAHILPFHLRLELHVSAIGFQRISETVSKLACINSSGLRIRLHEMQLVGNSIRPYYRYNDMMEDRDYATGEKFGRFYDVLLPPSHLPFETLNNEIFFSEYRTRASIESLERKYRRENYLVSYTKVALETKQSMQESFMRDIHQMKAQRRAKLETVCGVCLGTYSESTAENPINKRVLIPCYHTFCAECLGHLRSMGRRNCEYCNTLIERVEIF